MEDDHFHDSQNEKGKMKIYKGKAKKWTVLDDSFTPEQ